MKMFHKILPIVFILFYLFTGFNSIAIAGITMESSIDTTIATIGDPVKLNIRMSYPEGTNFLLPVLEKKLGDFDILDIQPGRPQSRGKQEYYSDWTLTLAAYDTGMTEIPPIEIKAQSAEDTTTILSFQTDSYFVNIISVLPPDAAEIKDIKPPFAIRMLVPWDIVIFALIVIVIIAIWIILQKRWKKTHPVIPYNERYLEPPHVIAIKKLNKIKENPVITDELKKEYYFELSEIIREYIERRFFIRALEMSSREILEAFSPSALKLEESQKLAEIFNRFDMVKFAKQIPEKAEISLAWESVYQFVDTTHHDNFLAAKSIL